MAYYVPRTSARVKAFVVDQILKMILIAPLWKIVATVSDGDFLLLTWVQVVLFIGLYLLYDVVSLLFFQKTPGQWVVGLQVISQPRPLEPLSLSQVLVRVVIKQLNLFFSYAPDIFMLYRYDRRTLADLFAETRVIADAPRPERAHSRWILASLGIVYFCFLGWSESVALFKEMEVGKSGILLPHSGGFEVDIDEGFSLDDLTDEFG